MQFKHRMVIYLKAQRRVSESWVELRPWPWRKTQEAKEPAYEKPFFSIAAEYPIFNVRGYFVQKAVRIPLWFTKDTNSI